MKENYTDLKSSEKFVLSRKEASPYAGMFYVVFIRGNGFLQEVYRSYYKKCAEKKFDLLTEVDSYVKAR